MGVYGFDAQHYLAALRGAGVRLVLDLRQRRGVRGPQYSWANSVRLQAALAEAGIAYEHHKALAPTTELRQLQYREDHRLGVGKRSRVELAPEYAERYTREILDHVDLGPIAERLGVSGPGALFCVEADPEACHRSLVAQRLSHDHGLITSHLRPGLGSPAPVPTHIPGGL